MIPAFYLIVSDADRAELLADSGVRLMQLRYKGEDPASQIARAMAACQRHGVALVVNDHWQAAIDAGAPWVHLGQGDLAGADIAAIRRAGLRLGISTHDRAELDRALALDPDYVALGPIWETQLKKMPWRPQGLTKLARWKRRVGKLPLVAIGGITPERASDVFDTGADSIAVVSDVQFAPDPKARVSQWLRLTT